MALLFPYYPEVSKTGAELGKGRSLDQKLTTWYLTACIFTEAEREGCWVKDVSLSCVHSPPEARERNTTLSHQRAKEKWERNRKGANRPAEEGGVAG